MSIPLTADAIEARLRQISALAELRAERRLDSKIGLSEAAVTSRLRQVARLRELCLQLAKAGRATRDCTD